MQNKKHLFLIVFLAGFLVSGLSSATAQETEDKDSVQDPSVPLNDPSAQAPESRQTEMDSQKEEALTPANDSAADKEAVMKDTLKSSVVNNTLDEANKPQETSAAQNAEGLAQEGVVDSSAALTEKTVTAIDVSGNKSIASSVIISKMKTKIGAPYSENIISDDLKRLFLLGYFSDVSIDSEPYKDGLKVLVKVVEKSAIKSVVISGSRRNLQESMKKLLKTKEGQSLDYPTLNQDKEELSKFLAKKGFAQAKVDYKVDVDKETNKANVLFNVREGVRTKVKFIVFDGNVTFSHGRLLKVIKTRTPLLIRSGILNYDVLNEDMERLKSFYRREGFPDALVSYSLEFDESGRFVMVTIDIQEGRRFRVKDIAITGNTVFTKEDILEKLVNCSVGDVYSQEAQERDVAVIQSVYFDKGYISVRVDDISVTDENTGEVKITYNITENEIAYVRQIKIKGNVKTKDVVIRRELRIRPGDKFDGDKLKRSRERLNNLGFFEEVSYDTEATDDPNMKDLIVEVKETKTGSFSFGGGYSTVEQAVGFVEIAQNNFDWRNFPYFTGDGQRISFRAEMGSISSLFDISFTKPWMFDYPVSFGFDAYKQEHKRDTDVGYGYDENKMGGRLRLGKEFSEYVRGDLTYRVDNIKISNISGTASDDLRSEEGKNTISSFIFGLNRDTRDNIFSASKGYYLSSSLEVAGGAFGGDKDFLKFIGRANKYFPMPWNSVLEFRSTLGLANSYKDSQKVPIYERFFAGGADTIRGYHERGVGPIDSASDDPLGGNALLVGNIEYTYPLIDFLKVAAFYDIGRVWDKVSNIGSGDIYSSIGLGLRVKTPIGPIKLDYGFPLKKEPGREGRSGKFHFSASHGF